MVDFLTSHAASQPDKLAVVDDRPGATPRTLTFAELEVSSNQLAHVLADQGVGPGTRVIWGGPNSRDVVVTMNAVRKIGGTAVPLNYRSSDDEAAYIIDHSEAHVVVIDAELAPMVERIRDHLPKVQTVLVFDGAAPDGMAPMAELMTAASSEAPAVVAGDAVTMTYTSGTTGRPKGAIRVGSGSPDQAAAMNALFGYRSADVHVTTGPLYHSGPGNALLGGLGHGQTVVVQRKFDAEDWLRLVDRYGCSTTFAAPTPIRKVLDLADDVKARYDRSSMRIMIANAAPWSYSLKMRYLDDFPEDSLFEVYGSTELGLNAILEPADQRRKPGSCGRPAPFVEVRLYDADGVEVTGTGPDAVGELYVRSPQVFADYHRDHDRFVDDHRDGFQTVGDMAYRDDEGFLYICDRKKDMIISGGVNMYPAEIEAVLEAHPAVSEAAVFGIPSEEWGETVHAVLVARPDAPSPTFDELRDHVVAHLARYKAPRSWEWAPELPKNGSGKVLKRELRAPFWADHTATA